MKTVLAYVLVILFVRFVSAFGEMLVGVLGILLSWMPDNSGTQVRGFIIGCGGTIVGISYGFVVFRLLVGAGSFGIFPFLTVILLLSIPILNDYVCYRKFKEKATYETCDIETERKIITAGALTMVLGELAGILLGGCLFVN